MPKLSVDLGLISSSCLAVFRILIRMDPHLKYIFLVKIQLFVTAKFDMESDRVRTYPHWFGSLDPVSSLTKYGTYLAIPRTKRRLYPIPA